MGSFWLVLARFGSFWLVPSFSKYAPVMLYKNKEQLRIEYFITQQKMGQILTGKNKNIYKGLILHLSFLN